MKKLIFILLLLPLFFSGIAQAESITLIWTPSISSDIKSYRVYQSLIENVFAIGSECNAVMVIDETEECMTKAIIDGLIIGYRYHFIVTAIDSEGIESQPSNIVSITIDPQNANPISTGLGSINITIQ